MQEAERLERERKKLEDMEKDKENYIRKKDDFLEEGKAMHHCVYTNEYYNQDNTLILSARIDGKRIETVELSLDTFKVVQSRGVCNSNTEYHDRIINLVESNAELIRQRMNKAA